MRNTSAYIKNVGLILLLFLITFGIFANTLKNSFVWDDEQYILKHLFIQDLANIKYIFNPAYFLDAERMLSLGMFNIGRPVWVLSAMIDYKLWGTNPFGYHLTNIILQALSAALLFILLNLIFKNKTLSFISALIFALHPIHTESINVITFRTDILALVFMLLSFITFIKALDTSEAKAIITVILSVIFYVIANFAKEMALTLPILAGVYLYLLVPRDKVVKNKKTIYVYFSLIAVIIIAYLFVRRTHFFYGARGIELPLQTAGLLPRLAVISVVFAKYLWLLFLPINLCADYLIEIPHVLLSPGVLATAALMAGILAYAVIFREKEKIISFAILWFFVTFLPISNLLPIVNIIAERYIYIPSIGFCIFLAAVYLKLQNAVDKVLVKRTITLLLICVLCFYAFQTIRRNEDWKNNFTIWSRTVKQAPNNARAHNNLARAYWGQERYKEALPHLEKAVELRPDSRLARTNLAVCYEKLGRHEEAKSEYLKAQQLKPTPW